MALLSWIDAWLAEAVVPCPAMLQTASGSSAVVVIAGKSGNCLCRRSSFFCARDLCFSVTSVPISISSLRARWVFLSSSKISRAAL